MSAPWVLDHAPEAPFMDPRRAHPPGAGPLDPAEWIVTGPDFATQMVERERLLAERRGIVIDELPKARPAVLELLAMLLAHLRGRADFSGDGDAVRRPDGGEVAVDRADPLDTLGRLVAEDFCLMLPGETETVLGAAVLCFPSRWLLSEKIGKPLTTIHAPVPVYDDTMARRVNRIFAMVRPGGPVFRVNWLVHATDQLHLPLGREEKQRGAATVGRLYLRTERQSILRLPETGAVCFSIRTRITPLDCLPAEERAGLAAVLRDLGDEDIGYRGGPAMRDAVLAALA